MVECRYCKTHVATGTGTKTEQAAQVVSARTGKHQALFVIVPLAGALILLAVIGAIVGRTAHVKSGPTVELAALSSFPLGSTEQEALKKLEGKQPSEGYVLVNVEGLGYDSVQLHWKADHPDHVMGANFFVLGSKAHPEGDKVLAALRKQFGNKLRKTKTGYSMGTAGLWLTVAENAGSLLVRTDPTTDVHWKERIALAWSVILQNVQGKVVTIDDAKRRGLLGIGFTMQEVATLDPRTTLDDATALMDRLFPGVRRDPKGSNVYEIPVRHGVWNEARFTWDNAKGGKLHSVALFPPSSESKLDGYEALAKCIGSRGGKMEETVQDHARGIKVYRWNTPQLGGLMLGQHDLHIHVYGWLDKGKHPSQKVWGEVLSAVGTCGNR